MHRRRHSTETYQIIYEYSRLLGGNQIMRNTSIKVGLFLCAIIALSNQSASAISADDISLSNDPFEYVSVVEPIKETRPKTPAKKVAVEPAAPVAPQPQQYTVQPGDSLAKIAQAHTTEWPRLFYKNIELINPDSINPGQVLVIPTADEQLAERPLPQTVVEMPTIQTPSRLSATTRPQAKATQARSSSAGNTYSPGYCTWYAKSRRPDLPNRMGNASFWVASAAAQGFATGSSPQTGAIGQQGNHVVYVESVNGDGTVTVSEMNWSGLYVTSTRTVAASNFRYIY